jgi:hypothetical protein
MRSRKGRSESKQELEGAAENNIRSSGISSILRSVLNSYTLHKKAGSIRKKVFRTLP